MTFRIIDGGVGEPDRIGFKFSSKRKLDGRCGAKGLATDPLLSGDFIAATG